MLKVTQKYIIAFEDKYKEDILNLSSKDWNLEVLDVPQEKESAKEDLQKIDYKLSSTDFAISFLKPYGKKVSLLEKLKNPKIIVKRSQIKDFEEGKYLKELVEEVIEIEKDIKTLSKEKNSSWKAAATTPS